MVFTKDISKWRIYMKRIISFLLFAAILVLVVTLPSCSKKNADENSDTPLKLGIGVKYYSDKPTSAKDSKNGKGQLTTTVAAVLIDSEGKVVKCAIDTAEAVAEYTSEGKYILGENFKTKYELGNDYGMKKASEISKEWYEQIDSLTTLVKGKNIEQIRKLVADGGQGTRDVIKAGCTINISDFVYAIEEAIKSASDSDATGSSSLSVKISTAQSGKDATADKEGFNELKATITVNAIDKDGKTVATRSGTSEAKYIFNNKGEVKTSE